MTETLGSGSDAKQKTVSARPDGTIERDARQSLGSLRDIPKLVDSAVRLLREKKQREEDAAIDAAAERNGAPLLNDVHAYLCRFIYRRERHDHVAGRGQPTGAGVTASGASPWCRPQSCWSSSHHASGRSRPTATNLSC